VLPAGVTEARLDDGMRLPVDEDHAGVVLAVAPGRPLGEPRLAGTLRTSGGGSRRFAIPGPDDVDDRRRTGGRRVAAPGGRPLRRRIAIAARAPDPAGGAAWGVLTAPSTTGATCFSSPAHLVGRRPALVDPRLGTASPYPSRASTAPIAAHRTPRIRCGWTSC
jgi:hypothetical protein